MTERYADVLMQWLTEEGYTHCFYVAGGNIMHLLDAVRTRMRCVPVVHEVAAGIAAEYFNESEGDGRAFALVTAGPGLTNLVTALTGAWLESRDLLVIGGQVKSTDLADGGLRQRGIQEVDGVALASPVCKEAVRLIAPLSRAEILRLVRSGRTPRRGPVFLEVCLDVSNAPIARAELEREAPAAPPVAPSLTASDRAALQDALLHAERPVLLLGGGVSRAAARALMPALRTSGLPLMTTWNGTDRVPADEPLYAGRPNTWGQRSANVLLQSADLVVALGTRLGLQQTGFNWQQFAPLACVAQIDVDPAELAKGHPNVELPILADADEVLAAVADMQHGDVSEWVAFCAGTRVRLPVDDPANATSPGFVSPFGFVSALSERLRADDVLVPCSSGGAFTVTMQALAQRDGQTVVTDKGLASMGYGLAGAIGAAVAHPGRRVVLLEGDGGFAQNMQELGTVAVNRLNLKILLFANDGYASIRMTQRSYFDGAYVGCDTASGLGLPDWPALFAAFGIPAVALGADGALDHPAWEAAGPAAFIVPIDPEQTYLPKISSRITASGSMESNPLHAMSPALEGELADEVLVHLQGARSAT